MTVRPFDEVFRDFVIPNVPASGVFHPEKKDIRDSLNAVIAGPFPDNRVIKLNNANEGTPNEIIVSASVAIPSAAYQVLYILNVTQENTGPVKVSGAINRDLVTNINQPVPAGYLMPGMALLCIDTGTELRLLSYGDVEAEVDALASRAEDAAAAAEAAAGNNWSSFTTVSSVQAANIPYPVSYLRTSGYYAPGDGGGALYKRVLTEPTHAGKVRSADGTWWELSEEAPDVKMFGAKGDGVTNDTTAIQSAIDYIARSPFGGVATVGTGTFIITATINWKSNVSLIGQAQGGTVIKAQGTIGKMFSIKDIWAFGIQIENMRIEGIAAQTIGLWVEQTMPIGGGEVVGHAMLRNVQFLDHAYGLDGDGIYALFDSYFEKVDFFNCSGAGAVIEGSAMTMVGCSFRNCQYGMLIRYLDAGSIGGPRVVGGLFVGNTFDVVFDGQLIRPTQFYGCWFEQSANHVIATLTPTRQNFLGLSFHGCLFQPGATSNGSGVITLPSFAGVVSFEDCTIVNAPYAAANLPDANWSAPIPNEGVYRVTSCIRTNGSSVWNVIRDVNSNSLVNFRSIMANRIYASDAAAGAAGLIMGDMYFNSSTGSLSLKN
ncbi:MAG: glycosyl hydrolase family 28-related protein [Brucella sp.]